MSKMDRQGVKLPADVERKWGFKKKFDNAMQAAADASEAVEKLDSAMDQGEIFSRLTNGGQSQGMFLEDGQLYINASYLVAGILKSLDSETFYLDLEKGILRGRFEEFSISGKTVEEIANGSSFEAQKNAESYADKAAKDAVESQSQEDVYNKLTNNGTAQGIYYKNGQLYINASYLAAGILRTLDRDTFYLDLQGNVLKILGKTVSWKQNSDGDYVLIGK